jgi:uncharacterized protein YbjT (DUF2867 family)
MPAEPDRILVTGANGHLGLQLISRLSSGSGTGATRRVRAVVRSQRAADTIASRELSEAPEVQVRDYTDAADMRAALEGCRAAVHLVGIIKEANGASYESAHEDTCRILSREAEAAGLERVVYLSIFGSSPASENACLASKGRAEEMLLECATPATILRVPMVVGPKDYASAALRNDARARFAVLVGGGATMQQPIDSRDVVEAIVRALESDGTASQGYDLGGPERLTHRALLQRAAALYGRKPLVLPVPRALARGFASLCESMLGNPPITRAMLEILQHDDRIDEATICDELDLELTPLDETLRDFVGPESQAQ